MSDEAVCCMIMPRPCCRLSSHHDASQAAASAVRTGQQAVSRTLAENPQVLRAGAQAREGGCRPAQAPIEFSAYQACLYVLEGTGGFGFCAPQ
jgi:hypothetical protein